MIPNQINFKKERSINDILGDTFIFIKQNRINLVQLVLFKAGLFFMCYTILAWLLLPGLHVSTPQLLREYESTLFLLSWVGLVASIICGLYINACIYEYIVHYQKYGFNNFKLTSVNSSGLRKMFPLLCANILFYLFWIFGTLSLLFPGLLLSTKFRLTGIILVSEKTDFWSAFNRNSYLLTNRFDQFSFLKWVKTFELDFSLGLMLYVACFGLGCGTFYGVVVVHFLLSKTSQLSQSMTWFLNLTELWIIILIWSIVLVSLHTYNLVAYSFLYYSFLHEKESESLT